MAVKLFGACCLKLLAHHNPYSTDIPLVISLTNTFHHNYRQHYTAHHHSPLLHPPTTTTKQHSPLTSASPISMGPPQCLMEEMGEAPVPPSCPEIWMMSALALATPDATVPMPAWATSFTDTLADLLTCRGSGRYKERQSKVGRSQGRIVLMLEPLCITRCPVQQIATTTTATTARIKTIHRPGASRK